MQDKAKRAKGLHTHVEDRPSALNSMIEPVKEKALPEVPRHPPRPLSAQDVVPKVQVPQHKPKSSLGQGIGRFARNVGGQRKK